MTTTLQLDHREARQLAGPHRRRGNRPPPPPTAVLSSPARAHLGYPLAAVYALACNPTALSGDRAHRPVTCRRCLAADPAGVAAANRRLAVAGLPRVSAVPVDVAATMHALYSVARGPRLGLSGPDVPAARSQSERLGRLLAYWSIRGVSLVALAEVLGTVASTVSDRIARHGATARRASWAGSR